MLASAFRVGLRHSALIGVAWDVLTIRHSQDLTLSRRVKPGPAPKPARRRARWRGLGCRVG
jgi:hypothetical protein